MNTSMRILGIDYGSKRVGIAMTDDTGQMAFPKAVIENNKGLIEALKIIINEYGITKVVLGESKNYKMVDNEIMAEILDFREVLEKVIGVDVIMQSEILSSAQAEFFQGKNKMTDAAAASIILQSYLDSKK